MQDFRQNQTDDIAGENTKTPITHGHQIAVEYGNDAVFKSTKQCASHPFVSQCLHRFVEPHRSVARHSGHRGIQQRPYDAAVQFPQLVPDPKGQEPALPGNHSIFRVSVALSGRLADPTGPVYDHATTTMWKELFSKPARVVLIEDICTTLRRNDGTAKFNDGNLHKANPRNALLLDVTSRHRLFQCSFNAHDRTWYLVHGAVPSGWGVSRKTARGAINCDGTAVSQWRILECGWHDRARPGFRAQIRGADGPPGDHLPLHTKPAAHEPTRDRSWFPPDSARTRQIA